MAPRVSTHLDNVLTVADIARTLNDFRPLDETLERICERVAGLGSYDAAALYMADSHSRQLLLRGSWGLGPAYVEYFNVEHPILLDQTRRMGLAPAAESYRSGRVVTLADTESEPSFEPWKPAARVQGYRSLACMPVILQSQVIGVLVCYSHEPRVHSREELALLQLVARLAGVAMATARIGDEQKAALRELQDLSERLGRQNEELSRLSTIQTKLAEELAEPDATALERTARTLAELTGRAVLVASPTGNPVAYAGPDELRSPLLAIAKRALKPSGRSVLQQRSLTIDGVSLIRIGRSETPLGLLCVRPSVANSSEPDAVAVAHAAALMAAEFHSQRADRHLVAHARPAVLLALCHGLCSGEQSQEAAAILGVPIEETVRLAVLRSSSSGAAHRLSQRPQALSAAGWRTLAVTSSGAELLVLLPALPAQEMRQAARSVRRTHREITAVGISGEVRGITALHAALDQARQAAAIDARQGSSATLFDDLGPFAELARDLPPGRTEEWTRDILGKLREHDEARGSRLLETLRSYVVHGGRVTPVAHELGVHVNTINQRLRRSEELGGFKLGDLRDLSRVIIAVEWDTLQRA